MKVVFLPLVAVCLVLIINSACGELELDSEAEDFLMNLLNKRAQSDDGDLDALIRSAYTPHKRYTPRTAKRQPDEEWKRFTPRKRYTPRRTEQLFVRK